MQRIIKQLFSLAILAALYITSAAQQKTSVDVNAFAAGMQQPQVQLFDVRTAGEFNSGHLPGALQADYTNKAEFAERVKYLNKEQPVYIYCLSGGRSAAAAKWMRENGFKEVVEMEGGINAWKQAGKSLEGAGNEKQLGMDEYNAAVGGKGWTLVDVGAAWCPPCRVMEPVLQEFLQQHKNVKLVKVDGGKDQQVMKAINATGLPTFILYRNGEEVWRRQGIVEKAALAAALRDHAGTEK